MRSLTLLSVLFPILAGSALLAWRPQNRRVRNRYVLGAVLVGAALVLGCADQLMGYLPTEDDIDRHSYAAQDASFLYKRLPAQRGEAERIGRDVGKKLNAAR